MPDAAAVLRLPVAKSHWNVAVVQGLGDLSGRHLSRGVVAGFDVPLAILTFKTRRREAEPLVCFDVVRRNTPAKAVHNAEIPHGMDMYLLRRPAIPDNGFLGVLFDALAADVHQSKVKLSAGGSAALSPAERALRRPVPTPAMPAAGSVWQPRVSCTDRPHYSGLC